MSRLNYQRQAKLQRDAKALKAKERASQTKTIGNILSEWDGLGKEIGEGGIGFFIWAGRTVGFKFLFETFKRAKAGGLYGTDAFLFVKQTIYSRLRETA